LTKESGDLKDVMGLTEKQFTDIIGDLQTKHSAEKHMLQREQLILKRVIKQLVQKMHKLEFAN